MFLVTKKFKFEAAHFLPNYKGKCEELHGHSYKLEVTIKGKIKVDGMVMDFQDIKNIVKKKILNKLDHHHLNEIIDNPSTELLSQWIWKQLEDSLPLYEIKLWETENSWVTYNGK